MNIKERLEADLKQAMLAGDKPLVTTLRGLKSAILYAEVASGDRETGIDEASMITLLQKEAKKRQESADLYIQGGNQTQADAELKEKTIIEQYLPAQLDEAEITKLVEEVIKETNASGMQAMGQVIGQVKQRAGGSADGATIARIVKEQLA